MADRAPVVQRPSNVALVLTTLPDGAAAERLARQLLQERLIACANLVPGLTSLFRWESSVSREAEVLMLIKTPTELVERLFERAAELHPYDVPELLSLPMDAGATAYCRWVMDETTEVSA